VAAIADELGLERFFTVGWSGGGPHAIACAALLPERVIAAATIASVAPRDAAGLDWLGGMGADNLDEFAAAEAGDDELLAHLEAQRSQLAHVSGPDLHAALGDLLSDVDRGVLTGDFADHLAVSIHTGLELGPWGWFDDDQACLSDWGFVPFSHGEWLAAHVAGARPRLRLEHVHLSLAIGAYGEILDDLLAAAVA
jgi:pimeloyl-ACP methyl ester carboxylesterase